MPNLFGLDIAGIANRALGKLLLPVVLRKSIPGDRSSSNLTGGTNASHADFACRGVFTEFTQTEKLGGNVRVNDRKILVLGASIASGQVPQPGDDLTIEGKTYKIVDDGVTRDPAAASYECHGRA